MTYVGSLRANTQPGTAYRFMVIDNASAPTDRDALQALAGYPEVALCYSPINLGSAKGSMLGFHTATAAGRPAYVFLLNNDTLLRTDCLTELTTLLNTRPEIGLAILQIFGPTGE